jgi:hypothetical protein
MRRRALSYSPVFSLTAVRPAPVSEITTARRSDGSSMRVTSSRAMSPSTMRVAVGEDTPASSASSRFVSGPSRSGSSRWYWASEMTSSADWLAARPRARRAARKKS